MEKAASISNDHKSQKLLSSSTLDNKNESPFFEPVIQPKLAVNNPDDEYEKEADDMAERVMKMPEPNSLNNENSFFKPAISFIQRKCAHCEEEEKKQMQRKTANDVIQKQESSTQTEIPHLTLDTSSLFQSSAVPDYLALRQPFFNRNIPHLWDADSALRVWQYNFDFFKRFGLSNNLSTTLTNFTAPRFIDSQLKAGNPTWWEITDRELNTSTIGASVPVLEFNANFSPVAPSWLKSIFRKENRAIQRKSSEDEEEKIQLKPNDALAKTETFINNINGSGDPLSKGEKSFFESRMGYDFSNVRIHTNTEANESAKSLNALAYTHGNNIVFGANQYKPETGEGKKLMAHELTHTIQQESLPIIKRKTADNSSDVKLPGYLPNDIIVALKKAPLFFIQRDQPDEEKIHSGISSKKAQDLNIYYWDYYKMEEFKPLRDYTPYLTPIAYANRTYEAQQIMRKRLTMHGKKLWIDGVLGPETLIFLRSVAVDDSLADVRFQIAGLGFDLEAIAQKGYMAVRKGLIELFKIKFLYQWNVTAETQPILDHVTVDEKEDTSWYDTIIFGGPAPATLQNFTLEDRHAILKKIYEGQNFSGRAAFVEADRYFLANKEDNQKLVAQDPDRPKGNTLWISYMAENDEKAKQLEGWFELTYPNNKALKLRETVGFKKTDEKPSITGLLISFYLPEITGAERLRINLVREEYLKEKAENIENFIQPRMEKLIALINDEDESRYILAVKIDKELSEFFGREELFEKMATSLENHPDKNYFQALLKRTLQLQDVSVLQTLLQLCNRTRFKTNPDVIKAFDILHQLKHGIQSHDYVTGTKEEQGVWLEKKRGKDDFLKVGDVTHGIYRISEQRDQLKEEKRAQLQAKMEELINNHLDESLASDKGSSLQRDMSEDEFMQMILEKAAEEVKITKDDIEEVTYEQAFRLKGVESRMIEGVEEFFVDYERVGRVRGRGDWEVTEASSGMRRRFDFENDLGWYKFSNMMSAIETLVAAEVIIIGGVVLLTTGAGSALIALGGGAKMVALSIGISVLIYAITTEHFTVGGFLEAVLNGYLMAVGFRLLSPAGSAVARWIGTATFKQKLIGLILKSIVTGGGTGAFTNVGAMLVEDILRGQLRSPLAYLKGASIGFVLGAMFELGGSLIIGPAFKAAGRNVLERITNIEQLKEFLAKSSIVLKPEQWGPEVSKAFASFKSWVSENLEPKLASQILSEVKDRASNFLKSFGEGFELTVHRQALDLIEVGMTREAVDGLEKLIATTKSALGKTASRDAVDEVLNQLVAKPERANTFLGLIKAADDDLMAILIKDGRLSDLASSDGILSIAGRHPPAQVNNLLHFHFEGQVNDFESWARGLLAQADDAQKQILEALENRGASVTPEALLRISQSGAGLSVEVLDGLARMVRKSRVAGSLGKMEEMLRLFPDDKMEGFLKTMQQLPEADFDNMLKLIDDPAQAAKLLKYVDDAEQLARLLEASGKKPATLDELFEATKGKPKAPQEIESLLSRYANDTAKVLELIKQVDGDAALLERSMVRVGKKEVEDILKKGQAMAVTKNDPASMQRFLQMAEDNVWSDGSKLENFIDRIHRNQAQPFKHTFSDALDRLNDFVKHHSRSTAPPPVLAGHGPLNLAAKDSIVDVTIFKGTTTEQLVQPHAKATGLQHYKEGHTFENFWFDPGKIDRAGVSTFWPPGTSDSAILKDLVEVLKKDDCRIMIERDFPGYAKSPPFIESFDTTKFQIGIDFPGNHDVNMFFPKEGARAVPVSKHILHGVKELLGL